MRNRLKRVYGIADVKRRLTALESRYTILEQEMRAMDDKSNQAAQAIEAAQSAIHDQASNYIALVKAYHDELVAAKAESQSAEELAQRTTAAAEKIKADSQAMIEEFAKVSASGMPNA